MRRPLAYVWGHHIPLNGNDAGSLFSVPLPRIVVHKQQGFAQIIFTIRVTLDTSNDIEYLFTDRQGEVTHVS